MIDMTAKVSTRIADMGNRAAHAKPAMHRIVRVLETGERALWARSGGKKWPPHPDGTPAGVKSGALRDSLTRDDAPGAVREVHEDHLVFGTTVWYSRFMQDGTTVRGKRHAPKRPVIVYRPVDRKRTRDIIAEHLRGNLK